MEYRKEKSIIYLSKKELFALFDSAKQEELLHKIRTKDLSLGVPGDHEKIKNVVEDMASTTSNHRDEHEIVVAAFCVVDFYSEDSQIAFEINTRFNSKKDRIDTLKDLNEWREGSDSDFIIVSKSEHRFFQLKRYKGELVVKNLVDNILQILHKYYRDNLQSRNLLILLQPATNILPDDFFKNVHDGLTQRGLDFNGSVELLFNDNCKFSVIQTVFPILGTSKVPWTVPSLRAAL